MSTYCVELISYFHIKVRRSVGRDTFSLELEHKPSDEGL